MLKKFAYIVLLAAFCWLTMAIQVFAQYEWKTVTDKFGKDLLVKENIQTGAAHRMFGDLVNINHYGTKVSGLNSENIKQITKSFLADYQDIIKITPGNLICTKTIEEDGNWYLYYEQIYNKIPVYHTQVGFTIPKSGKVHHIGADIYSDIKVKTIPSISKKKALEIAEIDFKTNGVEKAELVKEISLLIYPEIVNNKINYYLVYYVELFSSKAMKRWRYFVEWNDNL